jgi:2-keto-4-pentenoate hydratase/2-oxohepta-3-ene-1,7-dioic acid hydratase in catechol pathway
MKLARYRQDTGDGTARWGVVDPTAGTIRPIVGEFDAWAPALTEALATGDGSGVLTLEDTELPLAGVRLLAPMTQTSEITGSGVNYPNWVIPYEGMDSPFYYKAYASMIGPDDEIRFPLLEAYQPGCRLCYEIELVVVLGAPLDRANAYRSVLGYTVGNDSCIRGMRPNFYGMDLPGSKCCYHASSIGPWITTRDEVGGEAQPDLELTMRINGTVTQHDRTSVMNWPVDKLLVECDIRSRLSAGDLLYTGTCGFIGIPDGFYEAGDTVEAEIEGIGVLRNVVEQENPFSTASDEEERAARERVYNRWSAHNRAAAGAS